MKKKNKSSGNQGISTLLSSKTKPREIDLHEENAGKKTGSGKHKASKKTTKKN